MTRYKNKMIFYINSNDRESGTHGNFTIRLNYPPGVDFDRAVILDASIKRSWYLIEEGKNTFTLIENNIEVPIAIPEGNYSFTSFRYVLENLLNTYSPHHWSYNIAIPNTATGPSTAKYTYTCTGGNPAFKFDNYIYEQMGFLKSSVNYFVDGELISVNPVYFNRDVIHIHCDMIGDDKSNILQTLSAKGSDFSSINYQCTDIDANSKKVVKNKCFEFSNYRRILSTYKFIFKYFIYINVI